MRVNFHRPNNFDVRLQHHIAYEPAGRDLTQLLAGLAASAMRGHVTEPTSPLQIADFRRFWLSRFAAVVATTGMVVVIGYQLYDVARSHYAMSIPEAAFQLWAAGPRTVRAADAADAGSRRRRRSLRPALRRRAGDRPRYHRRARTGGIDVRASAQPAVALRTRCASRRGAGIRQPGDERDRTQYRSRSADSPGDRAERDGVAGGRDGGDRRRRGSCSPGAARSRTGRRRCCSGWRAPWC